MGKFMKLQPNGQRQTREPPKDKFDSSQKLFCKIEKKWSPEPTQKNGAHSEKPDE
jgi:hypothetical protein